MTDDLKGLLTSGGYGLATLCLSGAIYLYRQLEAARKELVENVRADAAAQRDLLLQTVPLSTKLADGVALVGKALDTFERTMANCRAVTRP